MGTDLRQSDLSGALLDPGGLERVHWQGAQGVESGGLTYPQVHNAGVEAATRAAIRRRSACSVKRSASNPRRP
jgi:hypothetical protein